MRLLFGNPVFSGLASGRSVGVLNGVGTHLPARSVSRILCRRDDREPLLSFPGSAVQTGDGLLHVVHSLASDSDPLPETVWAEGTRVFLGPRPLQLAGVALTSTGELRAVFARGHL